MHERPVRRPDKLVVLASLALACGPGGTTTDGGPPDTGADVSPSDACTKCVDSGAQPTAISVLNANGSAVITFPIGATGNVAPTTTLGGATTNITNALGLAADGQGNLYVAISLAILVFAPNANGNVAAARTIAGPNALPNTDDFVSVSVTPDGTIYAVSELTAGTNRSPKILVFPPGTNGNVAPAQTITGASTTMTATLSSAVQAPEVVALDGSQHALFFKTTDNGNVAPQRSLATPGGLALVAAFDGVGDLYIANYGFTASSVVEFGPTAQNTDAPIATLTGATTTITSIGGIAVDPSGTMYVANADPGGASILVFAAGSNGNVAPLRTISGASTTLAGDASQYPMPVVVH